MEQNLNKYCSMLNHKEIVISYCQECKIFMCTKCQKYHNGIFNLKNHQQIVLENNKEISEIFIGLCQEQGHLCELEYFCRTHNRLVCAKCITKIKNKINGNHTDCSITMLKEIESEMKKKLVQNIKTLEKSSINFSQLIEEVKKIYEKLNISKEELKIEIQKIFTKIRNALNDREDQLLLEVDSKYDKLLLDEKIFKQIDKMPNKIKTFLEKGKKIDEQWDNTQLNSIINDCLILENIITEIKNVNEIINQNSLNQGKLKFSSSETNEILNFIKKFGAIESSDEKLFLSNISFDQELVKTWLNNKKFISELLFRKSRDGSNPIDFHSKCDNKGITITFIETTKGYKFGGYTELQWDGSSSSKKDKSTFLFSFNNKQKYIARNNNESIACYSVNGPRFGRTGTPDIYFFNTLNKGQSYKTKDNTFLDNQNLTNGDEHWDVKEIEVFKIVYV